MRILVLNSEIPFPPITGAQSRTYHLLRRLSAEHDVTLVGFSWDSQDPPVICSLPVEVICVPWEPSGPYRKMHEGSPSVSQAASHLLAYESAEPWFVSYYNSATMESLLADLVSRAFDLILIEHSFMARFLPPMRSKSLREPSPMSGPFVVHVSSASAVRTKTPKQRVGF